MAVNKLLSYTLSSVRKCVIDSLSVLSEVDSYDASLLKEALRLVQPRVAALELASQVPPPIAAYAEYHAAYDATVTEAPGAQRRELDFHHLVSTA